MGKREIELDYYPGATVGSVWETVSQGEQVPNEVFVAVNMSYCDMHTPLADGDEIAYFPPVTGG